MHDEVPSHFLCIVTQHLNRLSVNSGQDAQTQSTGLHDPLTFEVLQRQVENAWQEIRVKPGVCDEELKVKFKCMGTIQSNGCRDIRNITYIS
jgi:hypothetical protein